MKGNCKEKTPYESKVCRAWCIKRQTWWFLSRMLALVRSLTSSSPLCNCCCSSPSHFFMSARLWSKSSERLASNSSRAFSWVVDSNLSHSSWSLASSSVTIGSNSGLNSISSWPSCTCKKHRRTCFQNVSVKKKHRMLFSNEGTCKKYLKGNVNTYCKMPQIWIHLFLLEKVQVLLFYKLSKASGTLSTWV